MAYVLVDDLTRVEITDPEHAPTVIAVDGHAVENDLSEESKAKLRELLAPYYAAGRAPEAEPEVRTLRHVNLVEVTALPATASPWPSDVAASVVPERLVEPPAGAILSAKMAEQAPDQPEPRPAVEVSPDPADIIAENPVPDAVIRTWARKYGIDCPANRQVSSGVRAMHAACNGGAPKAGARA